MDRKIRGWSIGRPHEVIGLLFWQWTFFLNVVLRIFSSSEDIPAHHQTSKSTEEAEPQKADERPNDSCEASSNERNAMVDGTSSWPLKWEKIFLTSINPFFSKAELSIFLDKNDDEISIMPEKNPKLPQSPFNVNENVCLQLLYIILEGLYQLQEIVCERTHRTERLVVKRVLSSEIYGSRKNPEKKPIVQLPNSKVCCIPYSCIIELSGNWTSVRSTLSCYLIVRQLACVGICFCIWIVAYSSREHRECNWKKKMPMMQQASFIEASEWRSRSYF